MRSDCWEEKQPPRDPATGELRADSKRFPSGMKALGDYVHAKGLSFAIYSAESTETCGGYPASEDHETLDAATFASWGVDYIKVDGAWGVAPWRGRTDVAPPVGGPFPRARAAAWLLRRLRR